MDNEIGDITCVSRNPQNIAENFKDFKVISYNDMDNLNKSGYYYKLYSLWNVSK